MRLPELQAERAQTRVIVGPAPKRPTILALGVLDRQIVDACNAHLHQPLLIELPVLVAVGTVVLAAVVVPLVSEAHRDPVAGKRPQLLDQPVIELAGPLAGQERDDFAPALQELGAVAPA